MPEEGWVLMQMEVQGHENEIPAAVRMVQCIDLRNKIVTGDAQLTQRELSVQVVQAGGEYVWVVKDNQPQLRADIAALFDPEACVPGFSPTPKDFDTAQSFGKGHGRLERRTQVLRCQPGEGCPAVAPGSNLTLQQSCVR